MALLLYCSVCSALCFIYTAYYLFKKVRRPRIYGKKTGSFYKHILAHCPSLSRKYWPTWWAINAHVITIGRVALQRPPSGINYKREIFSVSDGGSLALDWADPEVHRSIKDDSPILLILTGLTSSSKEIYVQWLVSDGLSEGYRPVVMSFRGLGGLLLKTPRAYCANTDDLEPVIKYIHCSWPNVPVVGIGISIGGIILVQHLREKGRESGLAGVATVSSSWDAHVTLLETLERPLNWLFYNRHLTKLLVKYIDKNCKHLMEKGAMTKEQGEELMQKAKKCSTIREFDETITVPAFGYDSLWEYYENGTNGNKLHQVKTPLLSINADNDPFVPEKVLPIDGFCANDDAVLVVPSHGGHIGFLEGMLPTRGTWMNKVLREFLNAIKLYDKNN